MFMRRCYSAAYVSTGVEAHDEELDTPRVMNCVFMRSTRVNTAGAVKVLGWLAKQPCAGLEAAETAPQPKRKDPCMWRVTGMVTSVHPAVTAVIVLKDGGGGVVRVRGCTGGNGGACSREVGGSV